jgi:endonuclease/exonuclease/phosphatase family metal-dependent hydrolase
MRNHRLAWQQWVITILITHFGLELIRLLFPTLVYYFRGARGTDPQKLALITLAIFTLSLLAWPLSRLNIRLALIITTGVALCRILVQLSATPDNNLYIGAAGVSLFLIYLPLALGHSLTRQFAPADFILPFLLGVSLNTAVHSALSTYDLPWQKGLLPLLFVIALTLLLLAALHQQLIHTAPSKQAVPARRTAWRFTALGPWLFLQLVVFQNVARLAAVSGWPLPAAGLSITATNLLGLWLATTIMRRGRLPLWSLIGLALLFTASLFHSETTTFPLWLLPTLGQIASFGLLARLLVDIDQSVPAKSIGRLALPNTTGHFLLVILTFAYYAGYDIPLGFRAHTVLPVAGLLTLLPLLTRPKNPAPAAPFVGNTAVTLAAFLLLLPLSAWLNWKTPQATTPPDPSQPIRVMTYNIHNGFNRQGYMDLEAIAQTIENSGANIIGLHEVSRGPLINATTDMAHWLSQRLDMPFYFGPTEGAIWGNLLLSRYPILRAESHPLPPSWLLLRRGYIEAEIDTGEQVLHLVVAHFDHRGGASLVRQDQAAELLNGRSPIASLIIGDLNATPKAPEIEMFGQAGWVDVLANIEPPTSYTYPSGSPYFQIDYIWVSPDLAFSDPIVIQSTASDHMPVVVTLK